MENRIETWADHLAWCKARALEYVERGDTKNAIASMASDLTKHPLGPKGAVVAMLAMVVTVGPQDKDTIRKWIEGWN